MKLNNLIPEPLFAKTINEKLINSQRNINQTICDSLKKNYGLNITVRSIQRYRKEDGSGRVPSFLVAKAIFEIIGLNDYTDDEIQELLIASLKYNSLNYKQNKKISTKYISDISNFRQGDIFYTNDTYDVFLLILKERIKNICGDENKLNEYITFLINEDLNK